MKPDLEDDVSMLSSKRSFLFLLAVLPLAALFFVFQVKKEDLESTEAGARITDTIPLVEIKTERVEAPILPKVERERKEIVGLDPETQDFLNLVDLATGPEDVFRTPAKHVVVARVGEHWVAQGDLLVDEKNFVTDVGQSEVHVAKFEEVQRWINNTIPYRIDPSLDAEPILKAIANFNEKTSVRFTEHRSETDYVYFKSTSEPVCLSYLGRKGGEQEIFVNPKVCQYGNILHEMMHAIGFVHEHSRFDRDSFLDVHWDAIQPEARNQFQVMTLELSLAELGPFDFDSILLYPSEAFSLSKDNASLTKKDGSVYKANRSQLSKGDIAKILELYPPFSDDSSFGQDRR